MSSTVCLQATNIKVSPPAFAAAVIGPGRIGAVHVRELARAGARFICVLGRSPDSTRRRAADLSAEFSATVVAANTLPDVVDSPTLLATVCSPHSEHMEATIALLAAGKYVLCEKPLLWYEDHEKIREHARRVLEHASGRLMVNHCNDFLLTDVADLLPPFGAARRFSFAYHTQGRYRAGDIPVDLLPHALSMLTDITPARVIGNSRVTGTETRWGAHFEIGDLTCDFRFSQGEISGLPELSFAVDDLTVRRVQQPRGHGFDVALELSGSASEVRQIENPMARSVSGFVTAARRGDNLGRYERKAYDVLSLTLDLVAS